MTRRISWLISEYWLSVTLPAVLLAMTFSPTVAGFLMRGALSVPFAWALGWDVLPFARDFHF